MTASPELHSAIYEGVVRHRRTTPVPHAFTYPVYMTYLDLDEVDRLFSGGWLYGSERLAVAQFRRADYLGDARVPLKQAVHDLVEERTGRRLNGPVRLLTNLRILGKRMNPVSFYYCFDATGEQVEAIVAEVTNTPWDERHAYVLDSRDNLATSSRRHRYEQPKAMHVSPFMPMDFLYRFHFNTPGKTLSVHLENRRDDRVELDATLTLSRRPFVPSQRLRMLLAYPWMTMAVAARIYWQALILWRKGVPFHAHPKRQTQETAE